MGDGSCYCEFGEFGPAPVRELPWDHDYLADAEERDMWAEQEEELSIRYLEYLS